MTTNEAVTKFHQLSEKYPGIILGGSAALIVQRCIIEREIKDLDIISSQRYDFLQNEQTGEQSADESKLIKIKEIKFDFFEVKDAQFNEVHYNGKIIKCQNPKEII